MDESKREMMIWLERLNFKNIEDTKEIIMEYFNILHSVSKLPEPPCKPLDGEPSTIENNDSQNKEVVEEISEVIPEVIEEQAGYIFERKLRGGYLQEINAFIPEGIVRNLNIKHGDLVGAKRMIDDTSEGNPKYYYTLLEKKDGADAPDRGEMNYCIIERESGALVVKSNSLTGEKILYKGTSYCLFLNDQEIRQFNLEEGDIVDVAYKVSNPSQHKVTWKHEHSESNEEIKSFDKRKRPTDPKKEKTDSPTIDQTLKGMNVMIVGNESARSAYQEQIEKRGGTLLWGHTKEAMERLEPLVKKADFIIFLLGLSGHVGMKQIKSFSKEHGVTFQTTFNQGTTSIVRMAETIAIELGTS